MQNEQPKIDFFRIRGTGEKITATIDFLRENRRWWLCWCVLPLLPLCAVLGWLHVSNTPNFSVYYYEEWDIDFADFLIGLSFKNHEILSPYAIVTGLALLMLFTSTGALMSLYQYREGRLRDLAWPEYRSALKRALPGAAVITVVAYFFFFLFCSVSFQLQLVLIMVMIPLALYAPTCQVGYFPPLRAAGHSLDLGLNTWGGMLMVSAGLWLVLVFFRGIPDALMYLLGSYLSGFFFSGHISHEVIYIIYGVLVALNSFVTFACLSVMMIGAGYQYGHAEEKYSSVSLYEGVRHFDEI